MTSTRSLVTLVGIFKDEAPSIASVIESALPVVDRCLLLDTGSTDGTKDIAVKLFYDLGRNSKDFIAKELFVPFDGIADRRVIDFGKTRNRVLDLEVERAEPSVFTLMLSGDEKLCGDLPAARAFLEAHRDAPDGAYMVELRDDNKSWFYPRVLRVDSKWRYRYAIHEEPFAPDGSNATDAVAVPGVWIQYHEPDPSRYYKRLREIDLPVLTATVNLPVETHDDRLSHARALSFLGQTHELLAVAQDKKSGPYITHQMAAMSYYRRRAEMGGPQDDVNHASYRYLNAAEQLGIFSHEELLKRLEPLVLMAPRIPELRYMVAKAQTMIDPRAGGFFASEAVRVAREAKTNPTGMPVDGRVEWASLRLAAMCAAMSGKTDRARELADEGIAAGGPKEAFSEFLETQP
jgi:hypothetical protein